MSCNAEARESIFEWNKSKTTDGGPWRDFNEENVDSFHVVLSVEFVITNCTEICAEEEDWVPEFVTDVPCSACDFRAWQNFCLEDVEFGSAHVEMATSGADNAELAVRLDENISAFTKLGFGEGADLGLGTNCEVGVYEPLVLKNGPEAVVANYYLLEEVLVQF